MVNCVNDPKRMGEHEKFVNTQINCMKFIFVLFLLQYRACNNTFHIFII